MVDITTTPGADTESADAAFGNDQITIAAGSTSGTASIAATDDAVADTASGESIDVSVTGDNHSGTTLGTATDTIAIIDNEAALPTVDLSSAAGSVLEGNSIAIDYVLDNASEAPLTLHYVITPNGVTEVSDITTALTGTINVPAGSASGSLMW